MFNIFETEKVMNTAHEKIKSVFNTHNTVDGLHIISITKEQAMV